MCAHITIEYSIVSRSILIIFVLVLSHCSEFYRHLYTDEFVLNRRFVKYGQICAALYTDRWHRAEIVDVFDEEKQVKVSPQI